MNETAPSLPEAELNRLTRFMKFRDADPDNLNLYCDTVDLAIHLAQWPQVEQLLEQAPPGLSAMVLANLQSIYYLAINRGDLALHVLQPYLDVPVGEIQPFMHYNAAYALALQDRDADAAAVLLRRPLSQLDDESVYLLLHVLMNQKLAEQAAAVGQDYCSLQRSSSKVLGLYALNLVDQGQIEAATAIARRALSQAADVHALCALGIASMTDDGRDAAVHFRRALELDARAARAWQGLGMCLVASGDLEEARAAITQATRLCPEHAGTWHILGWTHLARNDIEPAEQAFNAALRADPAFAETHGAFAVLAIVRGRTEEAEQHIKTALRLDPSAMTAHYARALLLQQAGQIQRAEKITRGLLESPLPDGRRLVDAIVRLRAPQMRTRP